MEHTCPQCGRKEQASGALRPISSVHSRDGPIFGVQVQQELRVQVNWCLQAMAGICGFTSMVHYGCSLPCQHSHHVDKLAGRDG
ncbi:hypothetical protein SARC_08445 [Sphaeroforma arctica JP610]|uniref:Uncharacterized protein n=1 Tax=Sphaeroforma arctica JP610 TaxID=667725 RepID=A0A0L0FRG7_9EUKA|nr:hypothetical protein SARC_08445 [Sphaeroforma arctica JP610]KNC79146.1 hypothetical protein SARC_08445 [Sphaeroforma arctica JP610]|eukprot:XP_014153048.1 hypothetical protein SARC_08445 [Sphaeroforma arctica JP610]